MFVLFSAIFAAIFAALDVAFGWDSVLSSIYSIALLLPALAVAVRRLHDIGKSGWWLLLAFIPIVGWIILIIFYCKEGDHARNAWGENPKAS